MSMTNTTIINDITITATFACGLVSLAFAKGGAVVKTCDSSEMTRFVRPESRQQVAALIEAVKASPEASAYWAARKAESDAAEAEYQARTGNYAAYKYGKTPTSSDVMARAMAVQG
jgi:hypothetical protein